MKDSSRSRELIEKYLAGTCTEQEKLLLERFYEEEAAKRPLPVEKIDFEEKRTDILNRIHRDTRSSPHRRLRILGWTVAATVLLALVTSVAFYQSHSGGTVVAEKSDKFAAKILGTKVKEPILTLGNGTYLPLDKVADGVVSRQGGYPVVKMGRDQVSYQKMQRTLGSESVLVSNTLTIPRGRNYQLTLSDGSKVWLNSESSITYPANFPAYEREVVLNGEAYFEVAKDRSRPFSVKSGTQTVRVLGTHFNVKAYAGDKTMVTTLLQGSVKVIKDASEVFLKPGQAAISSNNEAEGTIKVANVDPTLAVGWKEGYFIFNNEHLDDIMKKLARWYDVEIIITDNVGQKTFWGTYSKSKSLNELLNSLEQTGDVHFEVSGRRIMVRE